MINLEWLRTFRSIYECNNITEASKKLHMTQPGVSKHLSALEGHIGKKLFERTTRKLAPTDYGTFLYHQINSPLEALQKVEYYSSQRTKKPRLSISIGCTTDFFQKELLPKIYAFDMYIVTQFGTEKELIEALELETVQLLVGTKKQTNYDHQYTFMDSEELTLICTDTIEIPENMETDAPPFIKWLQKQPWFSYDNDQEDIENYWDAKFNTSPKIIPRYILPSYKDIVHAIQANTGFGIVPSYFCTEEGNQNLVRSSLQTSHKLEQKRYYAFKQKNKNLKEIQVFMEKMDL